MLNPDKNIRILRLYHSSAKWLIPQIGVMTVLNKFQNTLVNVMNLSTVATFGFHSYVSTSAIIRDYIKHPQVETLARVSSLKLHTLAGTGFVYYIFKYKPT